ncbi:hypothetical protein H072_11035 [Dactylellina haptotyla CBS 200.50]|uniref:Uncharacterized protein n=1 Tax=Dactylellina haptotyla (strain CBS 200.50) TaxID=1284197 RepID=S7ZXL8_DACHA|nr:hypothetical protein H072_11035 [Dactylellina haptotyla CBS 200.50]
MRFSESSNKAIKHYHEAPVVGWIGEAGYMKQPVPDGAWADPFWEIWQQAQENILTYATVGGYLKVNIHVVNDDGAGPWKCATDDWDGELELNQTAVVQENPAEASRGRSTRSMGSGDLPMFINLPKWLDCKGVLTGSAHKDLCIVRCENMAPDGPFDGCIFFKQFRVPGEVIPAKLSPGKPDPTPENEEDDDELPEICTREEEEGYKNLYTKANTKAYNTSS